MKFGYARVSTEDQSLDRQIDALKEAGCERMYVEKITGKTKERPELNKMIDQLRAGDQVVIVSLDRISRSTKHLIELSETFMEMEVDLISLKEAIDTTTPQGRFYFKIIASFAELERELIAERTKEGLAAARARGRNGGRPKMNNEAVSKALRMYDAKTFSVAEITAETGMSKGTLYRYLREREAQK